MSQFERPELSGPNFWNSRRLYKGAVPFIIGKSVLDFGCGLGHGSYFLHPYTLSVVGVDSCQDTVRQATDLFGSETLKFANSRLVFEDVGVFDVVTSIEVIEHLEKPDLCAYLERFSQIANSIYCTTPNGDMFVYKPKTPEERQGFHIWHYSEDELEELFSQYYSFVTIWGSIRDPNPAVNRFTGYSVFATNSVSLSNKEFLRDYTIREMR